MRSNCWRAEEDALVQLAAIRTLAGWLDERERALRRRASSGGVRAAAENRPLLATEGACRTSRRRRHGSLNRTPGTGLRSRFGALAASANKAGRRLLGQLAVRGVLPPARHPRGSRVRSLPWRSQLSRGER